VIARSAEEGSRSLVAAVVKHGVEGTHGEYMFDGVVTKCVEICFFFQFSSRELYANKSQAICVYALKRERRRGGGCGKRSMRSWNRSSLGFSRMYELGDCLAEKKGGGGGGFQVACFGHITIVTQFLSGFFEAAIYARPIFQDI